MSLQKFFSEQDKDTHRGLLFWPGHNNYPVRGPHAPLLKASELDTSLEIVADFHEKEFDLTVAADHTEYVSIMDRIVAGWYTLIYIDRWRDTTNNHRMVRLEWAQRYSEVAPQVKAGSSIQHVG